MPIIKRPIAKSRNIWKPLKVERPIAKSRNLRKTCKVEKFIFEVLIDSKVDRTFPCFTAVSEHCSFYEYVHTNC